LRFSTGRLVPLPRAFVPCALCAGSVFQPFVNPLYRIPVPRVFGFFDTPFGAGVQFLNISARRIFSSPSLFVPICWVKTYPPCSSPFPLRSFATSGPRGLLFSCWTSSEVGTAGQDIPAPPPSPLCSALRHSRFQKTAVAFLVPDCGDENPVLSPRSLLFTPALSVLASRPFSSTRHEVCREKVAPWAPVFDLRRAIFLILREGAYQPFFLPCRTSGLDFPSGTLNLATRSFSICLRSDET